VYLAAPELPPDTITYRDGGKDPGNLTPRPGHDEDGLSFDLNLPDPPYVVLRAGDAQDSGFSVVNDHDTHVAVTVPDMTEWLGKRDSVWTQLLQSNVTAVKR